MVDFRGVGYRQRRHLTSNRRIRFPSFFKRGRHNLLVHGDVAEERRTKGDPRFRFDAELLIRRMKVVVVAFTARTQSHVGRLVGGRLDLGSCFGRTYGAAHVVLNHVDISCMRKEHCPRERGGII